MTVPVPTTESMAQAAFERGDEVYFATVCNTLLFKALPRRIGEDPDPIKALGFKVAKDHAPASNDNEGGQC